MSIVVRLSIALLCQSEVQLDRGPSDAHPYIYHGILGCRVGSAKVKELTQKGVHLLTYWLTVR